jgi:hypothetical protein
LSFGNYRRTASVSRQFEEKIQWKLSVLQTYGAAAGVEEEAGVVEPKVALVEEDVVAVEKDVCADDDARVEAAAVMVAVAVAVSVAVTVDGSTAPVAATMTVKPPDATQLFPGMHQASPPFSVV